MFVLVTSNIIFQRSISKFTPSGVQSNLDGLETKYTVWKNERGTSTVEDFKFAAYENGLKISGGIQIGRSKNWMAIWDEIGRHEKWRWTVLT